MSLFEFVVRRLRWLARIPLAPQLFDSLLLAWTALRHPNRLRAMEAIEEAAIGIPGVSLTVHRLGGVGFSLRGRELGHLHGNGLLDLFTGRKLARELVAAGRAETHHFFGESAWVSYWVRSGADVSQAVALIECALGRSTEPNPVEKMVTTGYADLHG
jgi:hypothetical protein